MNPDLDSSLSDRCPGPAASGNTTLRRFVVRGITVSLILLMSAAVVFESRIFWGEWQAMREEVQVAGSGAPIGFHNVYFNPSAAVRPANWYRPEGDVLYLWAGWERNEHHWFKVGLTDLDHRRLSQPISRDVIRSVNDPWVEVGGGLIWKRMPPDALVVGQSLSDVPTAYPVCLLAVMQVVNDLVADRPYLALYGLKDPGEPAVGIYDARVNGERLTLGTSGYLLDGGILLYDHETESLWSEDGDALCAVTGPRKGSRLPLVARPSPISWSDWSTRNPRSRLLVGTHEQPAPPHRTVSTKTAAQRRAPL